MRGKKKKQTAISPPLPADNPGGRVCGVAVSKKAAFIILVLIVLTPPAWAGANFDLTSVAGGITLTQVGNNYIASFGTMNALGVGTPAAGVTVIPLNNGALYFTNYGLFVHGGLPAGHTGVVTAFASTNFAHPIALVLESCPSNSTCNSSGQYSSMSTNGEAQTSVNNPTRVIKDQPRTAGLASFFTTTTSSRAVARHHAATR